MWAGRSGWRVQGCGQGAVGGKCGDAGEAQWGTVRDVGGAQWVERTGCVRGAEGGGCGHLRARLPEAGATLSPRHLASPVSECLIVSADTLAPATGEAGPRGVGASRAGLEKSSARRCGQWRGTAALAASFPQVIILLQVSSGFRWLRVLAMVDILGGRHLVTRKGAAVEAEAALQNKVVALYFAAARCGPSRDFTQLLCDFYTALVAEARRPAPFEVVFVSADDSSQEMLNFMRELHGTWLALPFHDPYRQ